MDIVEAIKKACIEEQETWETDAPVTDGTEDICEGRAEFAGQVLRLIKRLEAKEVDSDELRKKAIAATAARTEESATKNSQWAPGALDRL
jgi:hypothetical protein